MSDQKVGVKKPTPKPQKKDGKEKQEVTKRKITKKTAEVKLLPKPRDPCIVKGCKNITAYMKRNRKTGEMEYWCVKHWKSDVEGKHPERYRNEESVSQRRAREKGRRVKKSGASASKRRVLKRSK